jgi:ankyrin repeat protein
MLFFVFIFYFFLKLGFTALIIASIKGHFEIVKFLIENNADVNIQDEVFYFFYFF